MVNTANCIVSKMITMIFSVVRQAKFLRGNVTQGHFQYRTQLERQKYN